MTYLAEISCPHCEGVFDHTFATMPPTGKVVCPACQETFNCHSCNYSWAKWARGRDDCGAPCRKLSKGE